jgi:hypothetical protein
MQDEWTLSERYRELVEANSLSIARFANVVELRLKHHHCDVYYRTRLYWR